METIVAGKSGFLLQLGQAGKTQRAKSVVQGHANDTLGRPHGTVEVLFVTAAAGKAAAVDVYQNGQLIADFGSLGGKDVQEQAVLAVGISFALAELVVVKGLFGDILVKLALLSQQKTELIWTN